MINYGSEKITNKKLILKYSRVKGVFKGRFSNELKRGPPV